MTLPSLSTTHRETTYPAIDPARPELSAAGKTVVITSAGVDDLGGQVALAFAKAGARKLALIGMRQEALQQTKAAIETAYPDAAVLVEVADLCKAQNVGLTSHNIRLSLGAWDIFAHCVSASPRPTTIAGADEDEWWATFETNTKFSLHFAKHFLPKCRPSATYIGVSTAVTQGPASSASGNSAYSASKLAAMKLDEYLAFENPQIRVFTMLSRGTHADTASSGGQQHDLTLPAHFMVWLASAESEFLRGT